MGLRLYRVKHGDSPSTIAQSYTGDSSRHDELLDANPKFQVTTRTAAGGKVGWKMLHTDDVLAIPEDWPRVSNEAPTVPEVVNPQTNPPPPPPAVITNAPERLPAANTPCSVADVVIALTKAWPLALKYLPPKPESIAVLVAQWALETGWGKSCVAWNLGNVKSYPGDGSSFTFFATDEVLATKNVGALLAAAPPRADGPTPSAVIVRENGPGMTRVVLYPDHPGCRFRAFRTLDEGALAYVLKLHTRFDRAWPYVDAGDPSGFAASLKSMGYFTAPLDGPEGYRPALVRIFNQVVKQAASAHAA